MTLKCCLTQHRDPIRVQVLAVEAVPLLCVDELGGEGGRHGLDVGAFTRFGRLARAHRSALEDVLLQTCTRTQ